MKIILKENVENLGSKGDIVKVAAGYGRNYLLPKKLALEVTSTNMKMIEIEQASLKKHLEKARVSYQDVIQRLNDVSLSFERKAGEKDTIFGSVSVSDIKEALDKRGFEIEKKKILLKEPIKRLGNFSVPIKVFLEDIAEIKIQVVSESRAEEEIKSIADKAKTEPKTRKTEVEMASQEDFVSGVPEEEEKAKEEPVVDNPEEKESEEAKTAEDKEAADADHDDEALKEEIEDKSSEKSKTTKE